MANNLIIFVLLKPKFLNEIFSFCSIIFIKKNWVVIKNINGNISNKIDGIFKKVKNILDFSPEYSVKRGIKELIDSLELGLYRDSINNKANYGNYSINI